VAYIINSVEIYDKAVTVFICHVKWW